MSSTVQLKKTPCNNCREKKRKCSYTQPCLRCTSLGIDCEFNVLRSPNDVEYIKELEFLNQIESFQYQINCMEKEIAILKLAQEIDKPELKDYPSPVSLSNEIYPLNETKKNHYFDLVKNKASSNLIQPVQYNQTELNKSNSTQPWSIRFKNGEISIDTYINSYSDLLLYLGQSNMKPTFPLYSVPSNQTSDMGNLMSVMLWRKYSKSRFKSFVQFKPHIQPCSLTPVVSIENLESITLKLLMAYSQCIHLMQLSLYLPAFIQLYLKDDILSSPAVMALCSMITLQTCRHLIDIVPKASLTDYGIYYFEQARELIEDKFDFIDLETIITLTYMSLYKLKSKESEEGLRYLTMAERQFEILKPVYKDQTTAEAILFFRFERAIFYCRSGYELIAGDVYRPSLSVHQLFQYLDSQEHIPVKPAPDDTESERAYIDLKRYNQILRKIIQNGGRQIVAQDYPTFISIFGHHIEMGMRDWYRHILPIQYQLSLPLFEDHQSHFDFFTVLETEAADQPIRLLTTIQIYYEYILMAKSYIPRTRQEAELDTEDLIRQFKSIQHNTLHNLSNETHGRIIFHWLKLLNKISYFRESKQDIFHSTKLDESDQVYFERFIRTIDPTNINFEMPIVHTAIRAAFNLVRLCQFFITRPYRCQLDLKWVLAAWEILRRAALFRYQQPGDPLVTVDRIRANLIVCLDLVEQFIGFSLFQENLMNHLQNEFNQSCVV